MTTREEWRNFFYADISAQLRRHDVNQRMFDGLYLSKTSITGSWLLVELVKHPPPPPLPPPNNTNQFDKSWLILEFRYRISNTLC